jgi:hypothetical protein
MKLVNLKENGSESCNFTSNENKKTKPLQEYIDTYFAYYQTDFFPETLKAKQTEYEGAKNNNVNK